MAMSSNDNKLMMAAIDIGTTFSGYAFSMQHDLEKDPPTSRILVPYWVYSYGGLISSKTSTTVLLNAEKKLVAFGFEAEEKYAELAEEDEDEEYYYFWRFKMILYNKLRKERLTTRTMISDIRNKQLPAIEVFTHAIRYLKQHLLDSLRKKGSLVQMEEIIWVLTVPAIWDDPAKQFMRKAAEAAGINGHQLLIALEPEAASIYCKHLPVEKLERDGDKISVFKPGSKYLVLDAGGGTIDITVHEVRQDGNLKELDRASGNDWGGTSVDNAYKKTLSEIVGESVLEGYCHKHTWDCMEMFRYFEIKKRGVTEGWKDYTSKITLKIPISLTEECEESDINIKKAIQKSKYSKDFAMGSDKLRINLLAFENFFEPACTGIIHHVKELLQSPKVKGTNIILMVGGFSESPLLQDAVRRAFPFCRVIIPQDAGVAVLKGAVLFGHNPNIIRYKVAKYGDGLNQAQDFLTCSICNTRPLEFACGPCHMSICDCCLVRHLRDLPQEGISRHIVVPYKYKDEIQISLREMEGFELLSVREIESKFVSLNKEKIRTDTLPREMEVRVIESHLYLSSPKPNLQVDKARRILICGICKTRPLEFACDPCNISICKTCLVRHLRNLPQEGTSHHTVVPYKYREETQEDTENKVDIITLLEKEKDTESLNYEHAHHDFTHLFTSMAVLKSTFPHANIFSFMNVTIRCPEDVPEEWRDRPLYQFLNTLELEKFGESFASVWQEYGQLAIAEKQLEMARNAKGPDLNVFAIVDKKQYFDMQFELKAKVEENEELSTRLAKFASQDLTEGNQNIADFSGIKPARLGEMFSQLFDDEWSEAFKALKPKEDTEEDIHPATLKQLQNIAKEIYSFCKEESENQLIHLEKRLSEALQAKEQSLLTSLASEETTNIVDRLLDKEEKIGVDLPTKETVERYARDFRKAVATKSANNRALVFFERILPELLGEDQRDNVRVKAYVKKCIELCWYMCMQDPPMTLVFPKWGCEIDENKFSHHGRRGKLVETCVWPALLLHEKGPVVCKGYILPRAKAK